MMMNNKNVFSFFLSRKHTFLNTTHDFCFCYLVFCLNHGCPYNRDINQNLADAQLASFKMNTNAPLSRQIKSRLNKSFLIESTFKMKLIFFWKGVPLRQLFSEMSVSCDLYLMAQSIYHIKGDQYCCKLLSLSLPLFQNTVQICFRNDSSL